MCQDFPAELNLEIFLGVIEPREQQISFVKKLFENIFVLRTNQA